MSDGQEISQVGMGMYRMSARSEDHRKALVFAFEQGLNLVDTSANYTDGESETLLGRVIQDRPEFSPFIMTKGGYIQGKNLKLLAKLQSAGKAKEDLVDLGDELKHSIHPDFLQSQIDLSLKRLGQEKIQAYLIHNPEYYFKQEGETPQEEYLRRLKKAFTFLEEKVEQGVIEHYGVSSNNFPLGPEHPETTDVEKLFQIANEVSSHHHFKYIQFPFNLLEIGAMEKRYGGQSLVEKAHELGLKTFSNRPLNAFNQGKLVRLASYKNVYAMVDDKQAQAQFDLCMKQVKEKWKAQDTQEKFEDIPFVKQFTEIWNKLSTPDAAEQVFFGHYFPFVAQVWGGDGLSTQESQPFYTLFEYATSYTRQYMSQVSENFRTQAVDMGLLPDEKERELSVLAVESYLKLGIDHVLVGMKSIPYVDQMKHLF